jgi:hypothetical protein
MKVSVYSDGAAIALLDATVRQWKTRLTNFDMLIAYMSNEWD